MHRTDPRAREHRDRQLGNHRHVDGDAVALHDAELLQPIREAANLAIEIPVGERSPVAGLAHPHDRGLVLPRAAQVAVDAVVGDVDLPADEPLRVGGTPFQDFLPLGKPIQLGGDAGPELLGVLLRLGVDRVVLDVGLLRELGLRRVGAILVEQGRDRAGAFVGLRRGLFLVGHQYPRFSRQRTKRGPDGAPQMRPRQYSRLPRPGTSGGLPRKFPWRAAATSPTIPRFSPRGPRSSSLRGSCPRQGWRLGPGENPWRPPATPPRSPSGFVLHLIPPQPFILILKRCGEWRCCRRKYGRRVRW